VVLIIIKPQIPQIYAKVEELRNMTLYSFNDLHASSSKEIRYEIGQRSVLSALLVLQNF